MENGIVDRVMSRSRYPWRGLILARAEGSTKMASNTFTRSESVGQTPQAPHYVAVFISASASGGATVSNSGAPFDIDGCSIGRAVGLVQARRVARWRVKRERRRDTDLSTDTPVLGGAG